MVNVLTAIKYGYILKNEDDDIPEELRRILAGYKQKFADLDYEIGNIRSLINVWKGYEYAAVSGCLKREF